MESSDDHGYPQQIVLLSAALAAVALALSACAPATPVHTNAPGGHHVAAPPSPTPTPTPTAASVPTSLVGTTCAQLGPIALLNKVFEHAVTAMPYPNIEANDVPTANFDVIAPQQLGAIECFWADGPYTILPDSQLTIGVLPNAGAAFTAATPALSKTDDATTGFATTVPKWGDASYTNCGAQMGECIFDVLVGDYWLHIDEINSEFPGAPYPQNAAQTAFLTAAVAAVKALPAPTATWIAPPDAANMPMTCGSAVTDAHVESMFGTKKPTVPTVGSGNTTYDLSIDSAAGLLTCDWSPVPIDPQDNVVVDILPGSSWAWSTTPPPSTAADHLSAVNGIPHLLWGGCQPKGFQCSVYGQIDDSWFDATLETTGTTLKSPGATLAKVETLAGDIIAAAS